MAQQRKFQGKQQGKAEEAGKRQSNVRQTGKPKAESTETDTGQLVTSTPQKPSEREGRPEAPRKDDPSMPGTGTDPQSGNALPDRAKERGKSADPGRQRDTLHIPSRTNRP